MSTSGALTKAVRSVIPKGTRFRISWQPTGVGTTRILRVVTPAWKSLPRFRRILKVQKAIDNHLPERDRSNILRISVLTEEEFKRLQLFGVMPTQSRVPTRRAARGVRFKSRYKTR